MTFGLETLTPDGQVQLHTGAYGFSCVFSKTFNQSLLYFNNILKEDIIVESSTTTSTGRGVGSLMAYVGGNSVHLFRNTGRVLIYRRNDLIKTTESFSNFGLEVYGETGALQYTSNRIPLRFKREGEAGPAGSIFFYNFMYGRENGRQVNLLNITVNINGEWMTDQYTTPSPKYYTKVDISGIPLNFSLDGVTVPSTPL